MTWGHVVGVLGISWNNFDYPDIDENLGTNPWLAQASYGFFIYLTRL